MSEVNNREDQFDFQISLLKGELDKKTGDRYIYGIASTESLDSDNAIVESTGLKKSSEWFLQNGVIDYDHRSQTHGEPGSIIGEPEQLYWDDKNRAHFKGKLYKTKKANEVWDLLENTDKMGLSVGGKILDQKKVYDSKLGKNVTKISKVFLNHIAVTPFPANKDTTISNKSYASFFKSLSAGSEIDDLVFDELAKSEESRLSDLKKQMAAGNPTANVPAEATGGVNEGANVQSKESLDKKPKKQEYDSKGKKRIIMKNFTVEFDGHDTVVINTENEKEHLMDKELVKRDSLDKSLIAVAYMDILKSMSDGNKEVQNIDEYLKKNHTDVNRNGRRIIKRHIANKVAEVFQKNEELKKAYTSNKLSTLNHSKMQVKDSGYEKDGVIYTANEDPTFIPKKETSIPTVKQMQILTDEQVQNKVYDEAKEREAKEIEYLGDRLKRQEYDLLTDDEVFTRYNHVRTAYGYDPIDKERFNGAIEDDRYMFISVIKEYDGMISSQLKRVINEMVDEITKPVDNDNQSAKVVSDTKNIKDVYTAD